MMLMTKQTFLQKLNSKTAKFQNDISKDNASEIKNITNIGVLK